MVLWQNWREGSFQVESTGAKPTLINVYGDDALEIDNTKVSRVLDKVTGSRFPVRGRRHCSILIYMHPRRLRAAADRVPKLTDDAQYNSL